MTINIFIYKTEKSSTQYTYTSVGN